MQGIEATEIIPGRCEIIDEEQDFGVVIDSADTPQTLSRLLDSIRETGARRIILVFGCEGERDKEARPFMGEIAHWKVRQPRPRAHERLAEKRMEAPKAPFALEVGQAMAVIPARWKRSNTFRINYRFIPAGGCRNFDKR